MHILASWACIVVAAGSCFGQLDAGAFAQSLQNKYGPPLKRETFRPRDDIEMVVDYAANGHVCSISLPPVARIAGGNVRGPRGIDNFVDELVPLARRGKVTGRHVIATGAPSVAVVMYEKVTIAESRQGSERTGVTITFPGEACSQRLPN